MMKSSSRHALIAWNERLERAVGAALRLWRRPGAVSRPGALEVDVAFAEPYRITSPTDVWVACLSGTAWLTREGCLADTILSPGDVRRVPASGKPLVVGMPRCRLRIALQREHVAEGHGTPTA